MNKLYTVVKRYVEIAGKDGSVLKIFIDNGFPIPVVKQTTPVSTVDISADRQKVAVIDEHNSLFVYDVKT